MVGMLIGLLLVFNNGITLQFGKGGSGTYSNTTYTLPTSYKENFTFVGICLSVNWTPSVMICSNTLSSVNISIQRWTNASYCGDYNVNGFHWITIGY